MKRVLILVISSDFEPYRTMIKTSRETWDSLQIANCETIFYCSQQDNPGATNHDNVMYFDVPNSLYDMGRKNLAMFEWTLANKDFDYVVRLNASHYCDKKALMEAAQKLPTTNLFFGVRVEDTPYWCFGGCGFIFSRDVIQQFVDNKDKYDHSVMEDKSLSYLANELHLQFLKGIKACSIDKTETGWQCTSYCEKSITFTDFADVKDLGHYIYRVKQDGRRWEDAFIMHRLFEALNQPEKRNEYTPPTNY